MTKSATTYANLCESIPGGVNSPVRAFPGLDRPPLVADYSDGDTVYDMDGRPFFDLCCSWGALIHGHTPEPIVKAVQKQVAKGISFGITTGLEERLCRKIVELVPSVERVRLVSSGTEATMSAVRLARGYTGRDVIVKFNGCYHGHADYFLVNAGSGVSHLAQSSSAGVPDYLVQNTISLPYNDSEIVRKLFSRDDLADRIAAVIVEPIAGNMGCVPPEEGFLRTLREETEKAGAVLIFDEVMTGFRVGPGGAQQLYGVQPDLTTLAKVVGGGFPVAAFGGKRQIMECLAPMGPVYQAGTLSGNPVGVTAGFMALEMLDQPGFYAELERKTALLCDPIQAHFAQKGVEACVQRVGSMYTFFFGVTQVRNHDEAKAADNGIFKKVFCALFDQGIYLPPGPYECGFVTAAHRDSELERARDAMIALF